MGLFRRGGRPKPVATVSVAPTLARPGDTVTVQVELGGEHDPELSELQIGIEAHGHWIRPGGSSEGVPLDLPHHREARAVAAVPGGHRETFTIPSVGPPSAKGSFTVVARWVAVVRGEGARRLAEATEFVVVADPEGAAPREALPVVALRAADAAGLDIDVPRRVVAGSPVAGVVTVVVHQDIELRAVTLGLRGTLVAYLGDNVQGYALDGVRPDPGVPLEDEADWAYSLLLDKFEKKVDVGLRVGAGTAHEVPIAFSVPIVTLPSFAAPHCRVHWTLQVGADLGRAQGPVDQIELNVLLPGP